MATRFLGDVAPATLLCCTLLLNRLLYLCQLLSAQFVQRFFRYISAQDSSSKSVHTVLTIPTLCLFALCIQRIERSTLRRYSLDGDTRTSLLHLFVAVQTAHLKRESTAQSQRLCTFGKHKIWHLCPCRRGLRIALIACYRPYRLLETSADNTDLCSSRRRLAQPHITPLSIFSA